MTIRTDITKSINLMQESYIKLAFKRIISMSKPDNPGNRPDTPPGRPENQGNRPDNPGRPDTPPRPPSRPVG